MTYTCALDRSSVNPSMAIFADGECVSSYQWVNAPSRDSGWLLELNRQLAEQNITPALVSNWVCGIGPGSFSGIRAALSAVQGMALPAKSPIIGIASSAAIASELASETGKKIAVVGDARRNQLWCVCYQIDRVDGTLRLSNGELPVHTSDDFRLVQADRLADAIDADAIVASPDWIRLENVLRDTFPENRLIARPAVPLAAELGRLAPQAPRYCDGQVVTPIYLHPAVATPPKY